MTQLLDGREEDLLTGATATALTFPLGIQMLEFRLRDLVLNLPKQHLNYAVQVLERLTRELKAHGLEKTGHLK